LPVARRRAKLHVPKANGMPAKSTNKKWAGRTVAERAARGKMGAKKPSTASGEGDKGDSAFFWLGPERFTY